MSFFGGLGAYGVAHYLPLDGTVFNDSRSVDSEPFIGMGSLGISARHGGFVLSFAATFLTDAFEDQRAERGVRHVEHVLGLLISAPAEARQLDRERALEDARTHSRHIGRTAHERARARREQLPPSLSQTFKRVGGAVVVVRTSERVAAAPRSNARRTYAPGLGSGVLISTDGKVLTAAHVVQTADAVAVEFSGGALVKASILASDPAADVALLQLEARACGRATGDAGRL